MCMCIYRYIYIYMYTHIHAHTYNISVYISLSLYIYTYIYIYTCVYIYIYMYTHICVYIYRERERDIDICLPRCRRWSVGGATCAEGYEDAYAWWHAGDGTRDTPREKCAHGNARWHFFVRASMHAGGLIWCEARASSIASRGLTQPARPTSLDSRPQISVGDHTKYQGVLPRQSLKMPVEFPDGCGVRGFVLPSV